MRTLLTTVFCASAIALAACEGKESNPRPDTGPELKAPGPGDRPMEEKPPKVTPPAGGSSGGSGSGAPAKPAGSAAATPAAIPAEPGSVEVRVL